MGIVIRTALALLLAVGGLSLATAAHTQAPARLLLGQSDVDIVEGEAVSFHGRGIRTPTRSLVTLQRKVGAGWTFVDRRALWNGVRYRFTTVPPRGAQRYRVRMVTRAGEFVATSPWHRVRVHWTPDVGEVLASHVVEGAEEQVHVTASGRIPEVPDGSTVIREHLVNGVWTQAASTTLTDHEWHEQFTTAYGTQYRYTLPAEGARLAASTPARVASARDVLPVDATTDVAFPNGLRHLALALQAGQTYTFSGPSSIDPELFDPDGQPVPAFAGEDSGPVTIEAQETGTFALDLTSNRAEQPPAPITISRPVVVSTSADAPAVDLVSHLPNQLVDLRFVGEPGTWISQNDGVPPLAARERVSLIAPDGGIVPLVRTLADRTRVWQLPDAEGEYTLRVIPFLSGEVDLPDVEVRSVIESTLPVDAPATAIDFDRTGRVAVLNTPTSSGADVSFTSSPSRQRVILDPTGTETDGSPSVSPTQEGSYRVLVSAPAPGPVDFYASTPLWYDAAVDGPEVPFDLGGAVGRSALIRVPVSAGDVVSVGLRYASADRCQGPASLHPSSVTATGWASPGAHPLVASAEQDGVLVARLAPCHQTGTVAVRSITPFPMEAEPTGHRGRAVFTQPGDVAVMTLDAGPMGGFYYNRGITFSIADAALTDSDRVSFSANGFRGIFDYPVHGMHDQQAIIVWAGPDATGWVDITADG